MSASKLPDHAKGDSMTDHDHPDTDLTDPHGDAEALRRENARLRAENDRLAKAWEAKHADQVKRSKDHSDYFDKSQRRIQELVAERDAALAAITALRARPVWEGPEHQLAADVLAELSRARAKFPGKNVTFAALVEEVGELATATFEESADRVRKEAVQVAVMAMRMVLDGDHCFDGWRAEKGLDPLDPSIRAALEGGAA